jgi:hypothetical protein
MIKNVYAVAFWDVLRKLDYKDMYVWWCMYSKLNFLDIVPYPGCSKYLIKNSCKGGM